MPVVAINSASQILTGRLHVLRRTSRTQLPKEARNYIGMAAETERGPLTPQVISSPKRFEAVYGKRRRRSCSRWSCAARLRLRRRLRISASRT
jgi:hypothetical protein